MNRKPKRLKADIAALEERKNALAHRLRKAGMEVKSQHPLAVYDEDGTLIGDYNADLLVDTQLIVQPSLVRLVRLFAANQ